MSNQQRGTLVSTELNQLRQLQFVIARAAQSDGLRWWDDSSLTKDAVYLFDRLFPFNPQSIAFRLALVAAAARHTAAFERIGECIHLFGFGALLDEVEEQEENGNGDSQSTTDAITSIAALQQQLLEITTEPRPYTVVERRYDVALHIRPHELPEGISPSLWQAQTLAWAYLEGKPNDPVFPYLVE